MQRHRPLIARALAGAALVLGPALALAQSDGAAFAYHDWTGGHHTAKPVCVYKGAMSDAEIQRCTGYPVHYDYAPEASGATANAPQRKVSAE